MQVFDTPGSVSLQIKLPSGRVSVTAAEEGRTSVELVPLGRRGTDALDGVEVTVDEFGGRHVIRVEQKAWRWGPIQVTWGEEVEVRIACPPGTDLELSGAKTDLRTTGELGDVIVRTATGDVQLESVLRRLEAKTASGDLLIGSFADDATLVTVSGDIEIRRLGGSLDARAVSGDVEIGVLAGALTLSTTSGDVSVRTVESGELRIQTVSGDVRLGVGRGTRVWIDASSVSGELSSELGVGDEQPDQKGTSAVVPLQVKTVSGDVSIVRAAERVSA